MWKVESRPRSVFLDWCPDVELLASKCKQPMIRPFKELTLAWRWEGHLRLFRFFQMALRWMRWQIQSPGALGLLHGERDRKLHLFLPINILAHSSRESYPCQWPGRRWRLWRTWGRKIWLRSLTFDELSVRYRTTLIMAEKEFEMSLNEPNTDFLPMDYVCLGGSATVRTECHT